MTALRLVHLSSELVVNKDLGVFVPTYKVPVYNLVKLNRLSFEFELVDWLTESKPLLAVTDSQVKALKKIDISKSGQAGSFIGRIIAKMVYELSELQTAMAAISNYINTEENDDDAESIAAPCHKKIQYTVRAESLKLFQENFNMSFELTPVDISPTHLSDTTSDEFFNLKSQLDTQLFLLQDIRAEAVLTQNILHKLANNVVNFDLLSLLHRYECTASNPEKEVLEVTECVYYNNRVECRLRETTLFDEHHFVKLIPVPYGNVTLDTSKIFYEPKRRELFRIECLKTEPYLNSCEVELLEGDCPDELARTNPSLMRIFSYCPIVEITNENPVLLDDGLLVPDPSNFQFFEVKAHGKLVPINTYSKYTGPIVIGTTKNLKLNSTRSEFHFKSIAESEYVRVTKFEPEEVVDLGDVSQIQLLAFFLEYEKFLPYIGGAAGAAIASLAITICVVKFRPKKTNRRTKPKELHKFLKEKRPKESKKSPRQDTKAVAKVSNK